MHPLTIEQNALTSFKSRTTLVPAFANTIGPALFLAADSTIGGADGAFNPTLMSERRNSPISSAIATAASSPWTTATGRTAAIIGSASLRTPSAASTSCNAASAPASHSAESPASAIIDGA